MISHITLFFSLFFFCTGSLKAQYYRSAETIAYIEAFHKIAIQEMYEYRIPASITLAQGILESGSGRSDLAVQANNHFGIKCTSDYQGEFFFKDDDKKNDCFRVYRYAGESYRDHSIFLATRKHYASLFQLEITDYENWAKGLKAAGYATNPQYPELLIAVIEQNNLHEFDLFPEKYLPKEFKYEETEITPEKKNIRIIDGDRINGIKFVTIKPGDTFYSISRTYNISIEKIKKYNDFPEDHVLKPGEYVFLQKKKRKHGEIQSHEVLPGETLHLISQMYGIRLFSLRKMNPLKGDVMVGVRVLLR
jgi:LysM repeat protein